ncbi:thiamine pyrophosphate-dependent dehydrogenase E1 component subunit alpha [Mesorhizobium sp. B2-4-9]|uniref:thiamine pyrophosphate-dependent dehydrogenase E1 component subunit alpha n=1 Tax=Mesorhizobium sp. B2-4-9 TaxID=2589940 RepID=UPI0011285932|nr:thiamine pyrophosphate-dependent dehydrogenase E1 component subunit alpha [Mesorhizobium sp. B2-4-9]TPL23477.1 thiamine pyrophosphate-dependent dehydrogenase E1 component subunit alpha [Mesorhizobium sp. B2-4-9]
MQMSRDTLRSAYRQMRVIRAFEDAVNRAFAGGEIPGFVHLYSGQEACAVGVCMHLSDQDYIGSTHRGHGHCIAKGCDVDGMMMEIFGKAGGLCGGKGGSMHIADIERGMLGANAIVGGSPPLAVGAALTAKTLATGRVAVAFTGDGGSNQGTMFEAMNMAVVLSLPVIFVVENNGYGEGTGVDYAVGSRNIAARAAGFGMPAKCIDGMDFFAVHEAMAEAVEHAQKVGPSFIEARCVRHHGHYCGDPQSYRSKEELESARLDGDPLLRFRVRVGDSALLDMTELDAIDVEIEAQIAAAVQRARAAADPAPSALMADVYLNY